MTTGAENRRAEKTDVDLADGRDETLDERMDRNWNEMLQELRVTQTGTQIITGFLLAIAFQNRFTELDRFQEGVYLGLVLVAVLTTALGLAPVNLHRVLFRQHAKDVVVQIAHVLLRITLVGVGITLIGAVLLIFDVVLDRTIAVIAAAVIAVVLAAIAALPHVLREKPEVGYQTDDRKDEEGWIMPGKKTPGPSVKDDKVYESVRRDGGSKEKAARIANASANSSRSSVGKKGGKSGSYDDWTVGQLRKRAKELGLSGYSGKKKSDLVSMLRSH